MSESELRADIEEIIVGVAPEVDLSVLEADENFRERFGLDSMDFLTIVERIAAETGVEIPEADYDEVQSLQALTSYVEEKATSG